ncbi:hypothetical protein CGA21_14925 [Pseudomonas sp. PSB11]|nr:hypothetical protein [Pseudomonas sp. PSB11]
MADVLRVRFWYEGVSQRTGINKAYELEQHFEPESFRRRAGNNKLSYRCKWQRYEVGQHTPQDRLAKRVDAHLPGSQQELHHPLWDLLKLKPPCNALNETFLQHLKPDVLAVLFKKTNEADVYWQRANITRGLMKKLECIASLDALAALIWLMREALSKDNRKTTEELAQSIYKVLIMRSIWWEERKLAAPLVELFIQRILPLGSPPNLIFSMNTELLVEASTLLNLIVHQTPAGKRDKLVWQQRVRIMRKLLSGDMGLDVPFALAPIYVAAPGKPMIREAVLDTLQWQNRLRQIGWDNILSNKT